MSNRKEPMTTEPDEGRTYPSTYSKVYENDENPNTENVDTVDATKENTEQ
jgi:hypothetical protein